VRHSPGLRVEEGGWGKGAGVDAALRAARAAGATDLRLDLGGQAAAPPATRWEAALADPDQRERPLLALTMVGGSLSTSGNGEHGLRVRGQRVGHLLDPHTGAPAPDFGSLTVWAPTGLRADCLSTGLFVMGPDRALAWAAAHPPVRVLVLERGAHGVHARASAGWRGRIRSLVPDLDVRFD